MSIKNKYHVPGNTKVQRLKKNVIYINRSSSIVHELSKCLGALMVARFGDIKFTDKMVKYLKKIDEEVNKAGLIENYSDFVTEAVPDNMNRRIDLVNLETNDWFEFETDHSINKENSVTIKI